MKVGHKHTRARTHTHTHIHTHIVCNLAVQTQLTCVFERPCIRTHTHTRARAHMHTHTFTKQQLLMPMSHTHDARPAHLHFGQAWQFWPVRCLSLGVRQHLLLIRRARWTNAMQFLSFAVCVKMCVHAQKCARSPTHECTHQADARHAQSALDQRQTHAEHTLGIRCMFVDWGVANT
jgi:hypothetical protein